MAIETWQASYPGLVANRIKAFKAAFSNGRMPGRINLSIVGFDHSPAATGDFEYSASETDSFVIKNCAYLPNSVSLDFGDPVINLTLLDRRWAWGFGTIDGEYNRRLADGTIEYPKTPRELATLLLDEMGETNYDITALPNAGSPAVVWRKVNPSAALEDLCATYGLAISLASPSSSTTWGDRVLLVEVGSGSGIPTLTNVSTSSTSGNQGALPKRLQAAASTIWFTTAFELEAVGRELDGTIELIDDLTYKPAGVSWSDVAAANFVEVGITEADPKDAAKLRDRAKSDVFKMWRVKSMVGGTGADNLNPPGYQAGLPDVDDIKQLTILGHTGREIPNGAAVPKLEAAYVMGSFVDTDGRSDVNVQDGTRWRENKPSLSDNGLIVRLSKYATRFTTAGDSQEPAELWLYAACEVEHPDLHVPVYYAKFVDGNTSSPAGTLQQDHNDVRLRYLTPITWSAGDPVAGTTIDNLVQVDAELDYYLDGMVDEYVSRNAGSTTAMGLQRVDLAGDVQSVSWSAGNGPPKTIVGLNTEVSGLTMSYKQSRQQSLSQMSNSKSNQVFNLQQIIANIRRTA